MSIGNNTVWDNWAMPFTRKNWIFFESVSWKSCCVHIPFSRKTYKNVYQRWGISWDSKDLLSKEIDWRHNSLATRACNFKIDYSNESSKSQLINFHNKQIAPLASVSENKMENVELFNISSFVYSFNQILIIFRSCLNGWLVMK